MSLEQILVVMLYTLKPYVLWLGLALAALVAARLVGLGRRGPRHRAVLPLSLLAGLVAALLAPTLTGSRLAYVATPADWVALIGIGLAAALYVFLLIGPLLRPR